MDGRSLLPPRRTPACGGAALSLIETRSYQAVRTARYVYVENATGELELYDLDNDPDELQSLHADPAYDAIEARSRACSARCARARAQGAVARPPWT